MKRGAEVLGRAALAWAGLLSCLTLTGAPAVPSYPGAGPPEEIRLSPSERARLALGHVIVREHPDPGRPGRTFEALGLLAGSLDEAFAVITDFRRYAEFMPRIKRAVVREEDEALWVVEILLGLPLGQSRQYRLKFESLKKGEEFVVFWQKMPWPELLPGRTIKDTSGRWLVRGFEGGSLLASYLVYTDPSPVPLGLTGLANSFGKKGMADVIEHVRARIKARSSPEGNRRRPQNSCP